MFSNVKRASFLYLKLAKRADIYFFQIFLGLRGQEAKQWHVLRGIPGPRRYKTFFPS